MPSRSPPTTPSSDLNHPHLIYYRPLSKSQPSIVTVPNSPTHLNKNIQTTPEENPYPFPPPTVTVQTLPSPSMTLQMREPPDLPTLLQLGDLLQDPKLYTPMIAHCNLHSPVLNLYKFYCHTMRLEEHHQFKRIKIPTQSGLVHALYQLNALPFVESLKEAPQKHGRRIFCTSCYHLGHYKEDCPFYWCPHCFLTQPCHNKDQCLNNPRYSRTTIIKQESPLPPPLRVPPLKTIKKPHFSPNWQNSNSSSSSKSSNGINKRGHKGKNLSGRDFRKMSIKSSQTIWGDGSKIWSRTQNFLNWYWLLWRIQWRSQWQH